ncbi:hypothetical protein M0L20_28480 [Spirosoma sp. RP8]|uniref:Uncharacterized protein n=1 Tax=Spirosoma liriopis TaxID=2937440 RepID=A0ABT0HUI1_9BACT|nr:hypothetical protein [Spirosoma liriopis]MCK8495836.1 hypothetical protein [Spirosoma liriopis]
MTGMSTAWLWAKNKTQTMTFDIPPMYTLAYITLSQVSSDEGTVRAYINGYRHRLPSGADQTVNFDGNTVTSFSHEQVTSVTFSVWAFQGYGYATPVLTYW